ncbi:MAG: hypothetical protein HRT58_04885 [Crocinitomicaceae bacterium]|nr:hypothetical protein [Flavobacteriales bacterium]NQZ34974.1 hypothetical protein [Crocinitomicaceae bacterium]
MKTIYSIALLALSLLLMDSCTNSGDKTISDMSNRVPLEEVKEQIRFYDLGLEMSPDTFIWDADKREITYTSKVMNEADARLIDSLIRSYKKAGVITTDIIIPFMKPEIAATSYFIHRDDITEVIKYNTNGIRVYMGAGGHDVDSSHIFIGPADYDTMSKIYTDYYIGSGKDKYLLDLTTPCPKACGNGFIELSDSKED